MQVAGSVALISGANRGIGAHLLGQLVTRRASKVYACARDVTALDTATESAAGVVVPLQLDITAPASVAAAAAAAPDVTLLINNAGVLYFGGPLDEDLADMRIEIETNYFGMLQMCRGFVPVLEANGGGAIVNVLTVIALAPKLGLAGYSASKAAAHSMTQALRASVAPKKIAVHGVFPGPVDTDMLRSATIEKARPDEVAAACLDGLEAGQEDIFPDRESAHARTIWRDDPKALEAAFTARAF
jgi:short-subunit dehydrogenase